MMIPLRLAALLTFAVLAMGLLGGCGDGQSRNAATLEASASVPVDAGFAQQSLQHALSAVVSLREATPTDDLKKLYKELDNRDDSLNSAVATVIDRAEQTVSAGNAQIASWNKEARAFTEVSLRDASLRRAGVLRGAVDNLSSSIQQLRTIADSYRSQRTQTMKALDLDLTQAGVAALKPSLSKVVDGGPALDQALRTVAEKSDGVHAVVSR